MSAIIFQGYVSSNLIVTQGYLFNAETPPDPPAEIESIYCVTVVAATGGYTDLGVGEHFYEDGTEVTVTAIPYDGYTFTYWNGGAVTDNPYTFTVTANVTLTPLFTAIPLSDNMTLFDYALLKLEQLDASTIFDAALTMMEASSATTLFDVALAKLEATSTALAIALDESVIFDIQIFDQEIFY